MRKASACFSRIHVWCVNTHFNCLGPESLWRAPLEVVYVLPEPNPKVTDADQRIPLHIASEKEASGECAYGPASSFYFAVFVPRKLCFLSSSHSFPSLLFSPHLVQPLNSFLSHFFLLSAPPLFSPFSPPSFLPFLLLPAL